MNAAGPVHEARMGRIQEVGMMEAYEAAMLRRAVLHQECKAQQAEEAEAAKDKALAEAQVEMARLEAAMGDAAHN